MVILEILVEDWSRIRRLGGDMDQENPVSQWTLLSQDSDGKRFKFRCSLCQVDLDFAVVFPEHGLRVCFKCVEAIFMACKNHASSVQSDAGSAVEAPPELSRGKTEEV